MKFITRTILALALALSGAARASPDFISLDLSGTSPAGASTTAVGATSATMIGMATTCSFVATVQGGTGGTLDIFLQTFHKSLAGGFWADAAHLTQIAAAAAPATVAFTLTRWSPSASTITTGLNTASGTPNLAAGTIVPGELGVFVRVVYKTGVGNTAGAAQTILATCSST
jgi:hypothetical protein